MKNTNFRTITILTLMIAAMITAFGTNTLAFGKKYAVLAGINDYPGDDMDLNGAVNDSQNMKQLLTTKFGFQTANITMLLNSQATRENILGQLRRYGTLVGLGDELVFHYSGHGTLFPDLYSDVVDETTKTEVDMTLEDGSHYRVPLDYYDSAIVPWNFDSSASGKAWKGLILDDELYEVFSAITGKGATVVFISDSCHSGSIGKAEANGIKTRFMKPERVFKAKSLADVKFKKPSRQITRTTPPNFNNRYIVLGAAQDNETALDGGNPAMPGGLFTSTLIQVINASSGPMTYDRLISLVRSRIQNEQHPRLENRFGSAASNLFEPVLTPVRPVKQPIKPGKK
jgi:hypothetical protein